MDRICQLLERNRPAIVPCNTVNVPHLNVMLYVNNYLKIFILQKKSHAFQCMPPEPDLTDLKNIRFVEYAQSGVILLSSTVCFHLTSFPHKVSSLLSGPGSLVACAVSVVTSIFSIKESTCWGPVWWRFNGLWPSAFCCLHSHTTAHTCTKTK